MQCSLRNVKQFKDTNKGVTAQLGLSQNGNEMKTAAIIAFF